MKGHYQVLSATLFFFVALLTFGSTVLAGDNAEETVDTLVDGLLRRKREIQSVSFTFEYGVVFKAPALGAICPVRCFTRRFC